MTKFPSLTVGDVVEIRPLAEIASTLDADGRLDGMPFMPEMVALCGQRATVGRSAHKTCDGHGDLRWLDDTVHLEGLRCTGSAHGGCQARCLLFWKTAWLKPVADESAAAAPVDATETDADIVVRLTAATRDTGAGPTRYRCQATEVNAATRPLPATELRQYLFDVASGNHSASTVLRVMMRTAFNRYQRWTARRLPAVLRINGGRQLNYVEGCGTSTPRETLDLGVGDRARIRPLDAIVPTLNARNMNRGLKFDAEMASWCGTSSTVVDRVERLVDDRTGEMIEINSDCVILNGVMCTGHNRRLCSRGAYDYWREIWLEPDTD